MTEGLPYPPTCPHQKGLSEGLGHLPYLRNRLLQGHRVIERKIRPRRRGWQSRDGKARLAEQGWPKQGWRRVGKAVFFLGLFFLGKAWKCRRRRARRRPRTSSGCRTLFFGTSPFEVRFFFRLFLFSVFFFFLFFFLFLFLRFFFFCVFPLLPLAFFF